MKVVLVFGLLFLCQFTQAQQPPSCLCFEELTGARNFRNPVIFQNANDTTRRRFVGEQIGLVYIFPQGSSDRLAEPFIDISNIILTSSRVGDERGLLAMKFHPNFRNNRKFYLYFSNLESGTSNQYTSLVEMKTLDNDNNRGNVSSSRLILDIYQPYGNHNGGDMFFGDDGYLYLALGDGGSAGDPLELSLDLTQLLGKIVRIDVNSQDPGLQYRIPPDNPFYNNPDESIRKEIWAYGVRNPWRVDIDKGDPNNMAATRGRIFVADVGQNRVEEVSVLPPNVGGLNLGWSAWEGNECYKPILCDIYDPDTDNSIVRPILTYPNPDLGRSITGGHVYRGCAHPNMQGLYWYNDYVSGRTWYGRQSGDSWTATQISGCSDAACQAADSNLIGDVGPYYRWLSWGLDEDEELYMLTTSNASPTQEVGRVYRVVDISNRQAVCSGGPSRPAVKKPGRAMNAAGNRRNNNRSWQHLERYWNKYKKRN